MKNFILVIVGVFLISSVYGEELSAQSDDVILELKENNDKLFNENAELSKKLDVALKDNSAILDQNEELWEKINQENAISLAIGLIIAGSFFVIGFIVHLFWNKRKSKKTSQETKDHERKEEQTGNSDMIDAMNAFERDHKDEVK